MASLPKEIGIRIRSLRTQQGFNQQSMADELGITAGAYAKIERGETDPSITRLYEIAKILKVNIQELLQNNSAVGGNAVSRPEMDLLYSHFHNFDKDLKQIKNDLSAIKSALPKKK